jgi:esterase
MLSKAVLLGNSLGGVNAYQFAARHPEKVLGLIIEDIGVEINDAPTFMLAWQGEFPTREALVDLIGPRFLPHLEPSFSETRTGWKLAFDPRDMVTSGKSLLGNHWHDWLATDCPALIIRGRDSRVTTESEFEQMAARRPNTRVETLNGSHVVHFEDPAAFEATIKNFLLAL